MKKVKKMAVGGALGSTVGNSSQTPNNPVRTAIPSVRGAVPSRIQEMKTIRDQNQMVYRGLAEGRKQFSLMSPERQNYRGFLRQEVANNKMAQEAAPKGAVASFSPAAYDPSMTYNPNTVRKAKGGSVKSSASNRGDGIASKGKTKGRMV